MYTYYDTPGTAELEKSVHSFIVDFGVDCFLAQSGESLAIRSKDGEDTLKALIMKAFTIGYRAGIKDERELMQEVFNDVLKTKIDFPF